MKKLLSVAMMIALGLTFAGCEMAEEAAPAVEVEVEAEAVEVEAEAVEVEVMEEVMMEEEATEEVAE